MVDIERKRVVGTTVTSQSDILVKGFKKRRGHHVYVPSCLPKPNQTKPELTYLGHPGSPVVWIKPPQARLYGKYFTYYSKPVK